MGYEAPKPTFDGSIACDFHRAIPAWAGKFGTPRVGGEVCCDNAVSGMYIDTGLSNSRGGRRIVYTPLATPSLDKRASAAGSPHSVAPAPASDAKRRPTVDYGAATECAERERHLERRQHHSPSRSEDAKVLRHQEVPTGGARRWGVAVDTVKTYSIDSTPSEAPMHPTLRQHYRPRPNRMPEWLRRIWAWC